MENSTAICKVVFYFHQMLPFSWKYFQNHPNCPAGEWIGPQCDMRHFALLSERFKAESSLGEKNDSR